MNRTQEMIKRLFLSIAISVAALIAGTSSAAADVTRCDGSLPAGTYDAVLVPEGETCNTGLGTVTVEGNVILQEGASIRFLNCAATDCNHFIVIGNLLGDGVNLVFLDRGASIAGHVSITGATGEVTLRFVTIGGNLNISDSNGSRISVQDTTVNGNALFQNNTVTTGPFRISTIRIGGNLVCNGNDPAPVLQGTITVGGKRIGQCAQ